MTKQTGTHEPRWLELAGAVNVRDVGGMPARTGVTRKGVLYRGDSPHELTPADVETLVRTIGLRQVLDLRTPGERAESGPGHLDREPLGTFLLPILSDADLEGRRLRRTSMPIEPPRKPFDWGYDQFLSSGTHSLVSALHLLTDASGVPAYVHCTAGRDRTGVLIALLLDAAGVQREAVVADYAATGQRADALATRINALPSYQQDAARLTSAGLSTPPEVMADFLSELDRTSGGARGWFVAAGVSESVLDRWTDLLVGA